MNTVCVKMPRSLPVNPRVNPRRTHLEVADAIRRDACQGRHDDGDHRCHRGHDGRLLDADSKLPHVDREVGVEHQYRYNNKPSTHYSHWGVILHYSHTPNIISRDKNFRVFKCSCLSQ